MRRPGSICCCCCITIRAPKLPPPAEQQPELLPAPASSQPKPDEPVEVYYWPIRYWFAGGWSHYPNVEEARRSIEIIRNGHRERGLAQEFHYTIWDQTRKYKIEEA